MIKLYQFKYLKYQEIDRLMGKKSRWRWEVPYSWSRVLSSEKQPWLWRSKVQPLRERVGSVCLRWTIREGHEFFLSSRSFIALVRHELGRPAVVRPTGGCIDGVELIPWGPIGSPLFSKLSNNLIHLPVGKSCKVGN